MNKKQNQESINKEIDKKLDEIKDLLNFDFSEHDFKEGEEVEIIGNTSGHRFDLGEKVVIKDMDGFSCTCFRNSYGQLIHYIDIKKVKKWQPEVNDHILFTDETRGKFSDSTDDLPHKITEILSTGDFIIDTGWVVGINQAYPCPIDILEKHMRSEAEEWKEGVKFRYNDGTYTCKKLVFVNKEFTYTDQSSHLIRAYFERYGCYIAVDYNDGLFILPIANCTLIKEPELASFETLAKKYGWSLSDCGNVQIKKSKKFCGEAIWCYGNHIKKPVITEEGDNYLITLEKK